MFKKLLHIVALLLLVPALGQAAPSERIPYANLMFPAESINVKALDAFARQQGLMLNIMYFTSDSMLMLKLKQGMADSPVDALFTQPYNQWNVNSAHGLLELDHELIPNMKILPAELREVINVDPKSRYMVPVVGGVLSIVVNSNLVDPGQITGYADLWQDDLKGKIIIPEDFYSIVPLVLKTIDCTQEDLLDRVWEKMQTLAQNSYLIANNTVDPMLDNKTAVAIAFSCDAYNLIQQNPGLVLITPREGYHGWVDTVSIPANSRHQRVAHAYIDYLLRPKVMARICSDVGLTPIIMESYNLLSEDNSNPLLFHPQEFMEFVKTPLDLRTFESLHSRWRKLVDEKSSAN